MMVLYFMHRCINYLLLYLCMRHIRVLCACICCFFLFRHDLPSYTFNYCFLHLIILTLLFIQLNLCIRCFMLLLFRFIRALHVLDRFQLSQVKLLRHVIACTRLQEAVALVVYSQILFILLVIDLYHGRMLWECRFKDFDVVWILLWTDCALGQALSDISLDYCSLLLFI
jgi:hypothetical protein